MKNPFVDSMITLTLALCWMSGPAAGQELKPLGEMVDKLAHAQHRGSWFRDHCVYFQRIYLERYHNRDAGGQCHDLFYRRQSVAEVAAVKEGKDEVVRARLISDTDGNLKPKKVGPTSMNLLGVPAFLELIIFPLLPDDQPIMLYQELIQQFEISDLGNTSLEGKSLRTLRLFPRPGPKKRPLVEGIFYADPETGAPVKLLVDRIHQLQLLDDKLKDLDELKVEVEFQTFPNGVTVPHRMKGEGFSRVNRYDGYFKFTFEEWGYRPNPLYPDVLPYFEKMPAAESNPVEHREDRLP